MYKVTFILLFTGLLFIGCSTKNYTASTTPDSLEEQSRLAKKTTEYVVKNIPKFYEQRENIEPNSKVFIMNAFPDEVKRSKAMFNYAIKLMNEKGICHKNKRDGSTKCAKPKIVMSEDGEKADLILDTLEGKMDKFDAFSAIIQFNKKYFPGFDLLKPEALLTVYEKLGITNKMASSGFYEYCVLDGAFEEELKKKGSVLVDDPEKADYIVLYQTLGCNERYLGHQPESLLESLKNISEDETIKTADNKNLEAMYKHGSFGLLNGYNYGVATSVGLRTAFTPTVIGFSVLGALGSGYRSTQGVAYEYVVIDKKNEKYYGDIVEKTRPKDGYRNGMLLLVERSAFDMVQ